MAASTFLIVMAAVTGALGKSSFSDMIPSSIFVNSSGSPIPPPEPSPVPPPMPVYSSLGAPPPPPPTRYSEIPPPVPSITPVAPSYPVYSPSQPSYLYYGSSPLSQYLKYKWLIRPDSSPVSSNNQLAKPVNKFSTTMYEIVTQAYPTKNVIISPLSMETILSLVAMAARGSTESQMAMALDFPNSNTNIVANDFQKMLAPYQNNTMLNMANAIYVSNQFTIQPSFQETATNEYYAQAQTVDYGNPTVAANTINTWVSSKTNNQINDLLSPSALSASTDIVLVNAVYFNGLWKHPFHHRMEPNVTFFGPTCKKAGKVNMMFVKGDFNFGVIPSLNATVVELPYKDSNLSMLIFLPINCSRYSSFNDDFGDFDLTTVHNYLYTRDVHVNLPEFSSHFQIDNMQPELTAAGLGKIFTNPDLSGMLDTSSGSPFDGLVIGAVVHKAHIKVNQLGATAAAATAVIGMPGAPAPPPVPPVQFPVDRSFTYAIMDKQTCIFIGQYLQP